MIWFGYILGHINHCRIFNAKSYSYLCGAFNKFPVFFFVQAFKIVVDS